MKWPIRGLVLALFLNINSYAAEIDKSLDSCYNFLQAGDYQRAIKMGKLAVKESPNYWRAHFCLGRAYNNVGDFKTAYPEMKKAESLASEKNDLLVVYSWLGCICETLGKDDDAIMYQEHALSLSRNIGRTSEEANALNNLASIFQKHHHYDKALEYFQEAVKLSKEEAITGIYNNIAVIYSNQGECEKAADYLNKAIAIGERTGEYHSKAVAVINLGDTFRCLKRFSDAETTLLDGLNQIQKVGDKYWEAYAYKYLGWVYQDQGDTVVARKYLLQAYEIDNAIGAKKDADALILNLKELESSPSKEKPHPVPLVHF